MKEFINGQDFTDSDNKELRELFFLQQQELKQVSFELGERRKELRCQNEVSRLLENQALTPDEVFDQAVRIVPRAFRFPERARGSLHILGNTYLSEGYEPSSLSLSVAVQMNGTNYGRLEVNYPEGEATDNEQVFLPEETDLLIAVAQRLAFYIHKQDRDRQLAESEQRFSLMSIKAAENELRRSEEKYRSLVDSLDAVVTMMDAEGRYVYMNAIAARPFKKTPEELNLINIRDLIPDQADEVIQNIKKVLETNKGLVIEAEVNITGDYRWYRTSVQPVRNDNGIPIYALMVSTNITEAKNAHKAIQKSEQKYRSLFEESPEAYHILKDGIIVECNKASAALFHADKSRIIGKRPAELSPEFQPNGRRSEELALEYISAAAENTSGPVEWTFRRFDGSTFICLVHPTIIDYAAHLPCWRFGRTSPSSARPKNASGS